MPLSTTKKPSPEIIRSVARPVVWAAPWLKLLEMPATRVPSPTWDGLLPPCAAVGAAAPSSSWLRVSWKTVCDDLKPAVLTLAMLLPVTSIIVWWERSPLIEENMERSTVTS